jgi:hypothetical protein
MSPQCRTVANPVAAVVLNDVIENCISRREKMRWIVIVLLALAAGTGVRAETPEEWVKLGARVHGGFGAFIPVGIKIGEDALKRLNAKPRELAVTYFSGEGVPCPCSVDGVMLAVSASPGQGSVQVATEKSPPGTFAVVVIRPRKGGDGLKYTVPMSVMPKLGELNRTIQDPLARYNAVMALGEIFTVEAAK